VFVDRLVVCGLVVGSVVVAVVIGCAESPWSWLVEGPAAQTGGGSDWEKSLAGDGFEGLRRAISHRGDRRVVCHREPESAGENPGSMAGFYRAEPWGREGHPIYV